MSVAERFMAQHFDVNQISPGRQREVRRIMAKLERWLPGDLCDADVNTLAEWQTALIREGISPSSVRTYINAVKPFYKWAGREGLVDGSTVLAINALHPPRGAEVNAKPRPYSRAEVRQFWSAIAARYPLCRDAKHLARVQKGTSRYTERAYHHGMRLQIDAIVSLALFMGLRRREIFTLSLDALHPDNAYVVVEGKRDDHRPKIREVPYNEDARQAVIEWFRWRRWLDPDHDQVWLSLAYNTRERPMTFTRFGGLLLTVGEWEYHRLRHTCATERLRAGMPIEKLQRFLGHATIQQTLLYTSIETSDIIAAAEATDEAMMKALGRRAA
jgi:site-specific recombinase XerD